ncbi:MAG: DUF1972 domain-containing protein [Chitinophagaceae bacterium]|nr:DUF1972 domain-containing protein [Chitinophagaceae bacterium]
MRIAILGTRGIPNQYGGFEQAAAHLSAGLVRLGHQVTVYNPSTHPYNGDEWQGARIIRCYAPPGAAGQFVYDLACTLDARKRNFDIWLILGYTSSSVWGWLYPKNTVLISNMDGLEWKRSKYSGPVRKFLRWAESLAVRYSRLLVADSLAIEVYLGEKYGVKARYIAYGAEVHNDVDESGLGELGLEKQDYFMVMARMEPENNIEMILQGYCMAHTKKKLLVIGNTGNAFGRKLRQRFGGMGSILFAGAVYDQPKLAALKKYCSLYFHGHSCGGTNPSLLEAMADSALVCAHDNPFNRSVLNADGLYFKTAADVAKAITASADREAAAIMIDHNLEKIREHYNWPSIVSAYEQLMRDGFNALHT